MVSDLLEAVAWMRTIQRTGRKMTGQTDLTTTPTASMGCRSSATDHESISYTISRASCGFQWIDCYIAALDHPGVRTQPFQLNTSQPNQESKV